MADKRITTVALLVIVWLWSLTVLTDIGGGDPDDQQSLIRLMVHGNEFDIEGLIASAPTFLREEPNAS